MGSIFLFIAETVLEFSGKSEIRSVTIKESFTIWSVWLASDHRTDRNRKPGDFRPVPRSEAPNMTESELFLS